jgi:hypothetical protein
MRVRPSPALLVIVLAAGCSSPAGPSDAAIARYVADAAPAAADPGAATSPATPPPRAQAGRVAITVERAAGVPDHDSGPGDSDLYVTLASDGQRFRTTVAKGPDPSWGDSTVFDLRPGALLEVTLLDEDFLASDEKVGVQTVPLPALAEGETSTLEVRFKNGESGTVVLTLTGIGRP